MRWKVVPIALFAVALTGATEPPPTAKQRYAEVKSIGTEFCFERLTRGSPQVGTTIVQAGTNATDLCDCVGELFATSTISTLASAKEFSLDFDPESPTFRLFNGLNDICISRLRDSGEN